jgi:DNA-binding CsgD family transcriptional regulator
MAAHRPTGKRSWRSTDTRSRWTDATGRRTVSGREMSPPPALMTMGLEAFAERAARELLAPGATARKRTVETGSDLTAQEAQIARLARDGLSNPEIGARLFISPRTVQYHLHKVFPSSTSAPAPSSTAPFPASGAPRSGASGRSACAHRRPAMPRATAMMFRPDTLQVVRQPRRPVVTTASPRRCRRRW